MNRFQYSKHKIKNAIKYLKSKKGVATSFITKFPGQFTVKKGELYGAGKKVIANEGRETFLRNIIYGKKQEYAFGRDSLFAQLKNEVINISKRDIENFLNAQGPVIHRRARPPKEKREHLRNIKKVGQLSIDLVHVRAKDFENLFPGSTRRAKWLRLYGPPGGQRISTGPLFFKCCRHVNIFFVN